MAAQALLSVVSKGMQQPNTFQRWRSLTPTVIDILQMFFFPSLLTIVSILRPYSASPGGRADNTACARQRAESWRSRHAAQNQKVAVRA